jgi:hypothetical protein
MHKCGYVCGYRAVVPPRIRAHSSLLRRRPKASPGSQHLEGAAVGASSAPGKLNSRENKYLVRELSVKWPAAPRYSFSMLSCQIQPNRQFLGHLGTDRYDLPGFWYVGNVLTRPALRSIRWRISAGYSGDREQSATAQSQAELGVLWARMLIMARGRCPRRLMQFEKPKAPSDLSRIFMDSGQKATDSHET